VKITLDWLKDHDACSDARAAFAEKFPDGAEYGVVQDALRAEHKLEWSVWLTDRAWRNLIAAPDSIGAFAVSEVERAIAGTKNSPNSASGYGSKAASSGNYSTAASSGDGSTAASSGDYSKAASSGDGSTAASSGYGSTAASSGNYSTAASSGDGSKAASSGNYSTAASSGDGSTAASSGNYSTAASSGNYSTAASSGDYTVAMVAGISGRAKAGESGCIALCWYDGTRNRIVVGYVGEDGIKADTWYRVESGKLVETA
jgi:hypothetical protein